MGLAIARVYSQLWLQFPTDLGEGLVSLALRVLSVCASSDTSLSLYLSFPTCEAAAMASKRELAKAGIC